MDSATIVSAALDSTQLEQSINKLVQTVASKTKEMADNFTSEVGRMEQAVKNLGNIKIDSGGAADSSISKQTKAQNDATQATDRRVQKEKELNMTLDQGGDILQKVARYASEVRLPDAAKSARESFQAFYKGFNEQARQIEPLIQSWEKLLQARHTGNIEQVAQKIAQVKHEIAELVKEQANLSKTKPQGYLDEIAKRNPQIKALREQLISLETEHQKLKASDPFKDNPYLNTLREKLQGVKSAMNDADTTNRRWLQTTQQLTEAQKKSVDEQMKLFYTRTMKIPTDQYDMQIAKLERIQSLLQSYRRGEVSFTPAQLSGLEKEERTLLTIVGAHREIYQTQQQVASSTQQTAQSAHQYTEEIRRQAQAIRESAQWREKGYATVGGVNVYNLEKDTTPLKSRISLEEQLVRLHKSEESSMLQQAADEEKVAQATRLTGEELKKIYQDQKAVNEEINKRANGVRNGGTTPFQSYDSLRQSIASVLGIQEQQVKMANTEKDSYNQLSSTLKQLRQAYDALSKSDRNSDQGKVLVASMHEVERAMQRIKAQAARPVSLESIIGINGKGGLSEKTLDDIAYKMRQLASYRSGLNVETQKKEINTVNQEYDRLKKKMDEVMQKNQSMIASNNALGRSWNYMKNRLAFYFTVGASTQFIKNLIEVRSQYEMNERALGILINSAERGTQIFNELSQMALVSPYTLIELSAAAKQLTAYDIAARDVVDTTRRLADMASAVGVPIDRLTYALGQIKAYGYLNSRDARMFANAGIPLVKQLSDYYTELEGKMVSTADVYDRMKKKAIDYNSVMSVITKMTDEGGKFFDFQAKMADTLKVRLANLTLAWNNMLNDMGKETQGVLTFGIGALRELFLHWRQLDNAIRDAAWILGLRTGFMLIAYAALKAGGALGITTRQMALSSVVGTKLAGVLGTLGRSIATIAKSPLTWWTLLALAAWDIFDAFVNADKATIEFNKSLRDSAKTTYEDLKKFAEQYKNVRDSLYKTETFKSNKDNTVTTTLPQNIEEGEAKKVWEVMREQIELSSHASDEYISKLLSIENVSERLRQGFQILDDIQTVSAALKEIGEDGIKVTQGWAAWWNAWQGADGLIENVKDLQKEIQRLRDTGQDPNDKFTKVIDKDYATALERFRKDLKVTTDSVLDFINLNGWSGDTGKIDEVFKQVTDKLATQGNLDPQTAFTLQKDVEIARAKAAKEALEIRISDEKKALATASDEISKQQIQKNLETLEQQKRDFDKFNGENRAYWNDFTKYIKERHISELTAAYNSMTDHGKKAMDFQSEEWQKRVHDWANRYEKSHNLATDSVFNRLRNWINDANTWSVFIKMTISTEDGKSVYKQLEEYDKAADDAWKTMQRLDKRISQLRKKGAKEIEGAETGAIDLSRVSADDKELTEALKERTQAQKDYNNAIEKGGESKKSDTAASKAQKAAESELQKALRDELQLIDRVRSQYKKLTDAGANSGEALAYVTNQFGNSLARINSILGKNGIPLFDISKFAGTDNPQALLDMLKLQLDSAKVAKNIKPEEIKELEVKYSEIVVDAKAYNLSKITKGLNNELDRLKDEYELAVSLDADPELGNMFADWMGIDINDLPRTAQEYANEASKVLNKELKELGANVELPNLLSITDDDMRAFEQNKTLTQEQLELVKKGVEAARGFQRKETDDRIKDWDKLLEKYAEYETKVNKIHDDAVKERVSFAQQFAKNEEDKSLALNLQTQILAATDPQEKQKLIEQLQELVLRIAGDDKTKINLVTAINNSEQQGVAKANFEEFQKTPEWLIATGDLSTLTDKALGGLIRRIEEYKKKAKELDPKQIKNLNNALKNLRKQQREGNPFLQIANAIDEAQERAAELKPEMDSIMSDIIALEEEIGDSDATEEQEEHLKTLKERWKDLAEQGNVSATAVVGAINSSIAAASQAVSMFTDMADALGGQHMTEATQTIKDVTGVLEKAGQGAAIGAQIGGGWGALVGGVAGGLAGLITNFADRWSGNKAITDSVKDSERAVRRLELAYVDLQQAVDKAYGTAVIGAKQATLANKELQLAEIQRQIELEKSRKSKNRDEDRIIELEKQYKELFYEIRNGYTEIVDDLMGTDVGSFAENLVSSMIDAFKQGEDYMKVFSDSFDEMIDNMIMKSIVSRVVSQYLDAIWEDVNKHINERTKEESEDAAKAQNEAVRRAGLSNDEARQEIASLRSNGLGEYLTALVTVTQRDIDDYKKAALDEEKAMQARLKAASAFTGSDVDYVMQRVTEIMPELGQKLKDILGEYYKFGESSETQLSALQQGIQGITEDTAGALEAYMNGVSQQVYLQSDLLTQIRDAVVGFSLDVQVATMSQILLQLQQSYAVQMSIESILTGWSSPSGLAVRVEMQ